MTNPLFTPLAILVWSSMIFLAGLFILLLWRIATGYIDINSLIVEAGQNVSHFQMLVFTSVFGVTIFVVAIGTYPPRFPEVPQGFIWLMGASYGVYFLDKGFSLIRGGHNKEGEHGLSEKVRELEERLDRMGARNPFK